MDRSLYVFFRTAGHSPRTEGVVKAFSKLGEHGLLWQGIALGGAAIDGDRRREWIRAWGVIAGSFAANQAIKLGFRRPRPDVPGLPPLMGTLSNRSYPSAHVTTSTAAARVLPALIAAAISNRGGSAPTLASAVAPAVACAAAAMALSRLYLGVHWPSDTLAGIALGAAVGELGS